MTSIVPIITGFVLSLLLICGLSILFGIAMILFVFVQAMWQDLWNRGDDNEG